MQVDIQINCNNIGSDSKGKEVKRKNKQMESN